MTNARRARGLSLVELIVVVGILSVLILAVMSTMPRRQEIARRASCQRSLMQIGTALVLYNQAAGHLPVVPALGSPASRDTSPLRALLEKLGQSDFEELADPKHAPAPQPGLRISERRVAGFVCTSDNNARGASFPAPVSYRATTGDTPEGLHGAFSPGVPTDLSTIEAGDGAGYTAAFSERLVGDDRPASAAVNYAIAPAPLPADGCPPAQDSDWKGDAGSSWFASDWRSTLYHHARGPNAAPSCIAGDERSAFMGASSGHPAGVNVLFFDGSVKLYTSTVQPNIWRALATPKSLAGP